MQILCGIDIVDVDRIKKNIRKPGFIQRVYTDIEIGYCESKKIRAYESYAARFAAKEAFSKALGTGISNGISFTDIEVKNIDGKPILSLYNKAKELINKKGTCSIDVSISHTQQSAIACVVILIIESHQGDET